MLKRSVVAVCGKGGVGKTVVSGAMVRVLTEKGLNVLAVDADPAMGLSYILGLETNIRTLGDVREDLVRSARTKKDPEDIADSTDYLVLEALVETEKFSFIAMGRSLSKGCFCPVNSLLKESIKRLAANYDFVILDAEAGIEQINREVMSDVDSLVALVDSSHRSLHSLDLIQSVLKDTNSRARMGVVFNRSKESDDLDAVKRFVASGTEIWALIAEDEELRRNDATGKSIFDLPAYSPVLKSAATIVRFLIQAKGVKK
jgi:CO dehydrogenase maturation factor